MKGVKLVLSRVLLAAMIVVQVFGTTNISKVQAATSKNLESVIVSGGTFDTGIRINQNYSAELTFSLSTLNQYKNLYVAAGSKYNVYRMRYEANSGLFAAHGWYNQKVYVPKVNEEVTIANKKNAIYVNGTKVLTETYQSIDAVSNLQFGDFKGSIKSFRVWNESNTLVASYIPVLDENSKACMYDTVNKKYVYYSGTCQAGKVVVDETPIVPDVSDQTETEKTDSTETSGTEEKNDTDSDASIQYAEALELNSGSFDTVILINQDYSIEMIFSLANTTQYKDLYSATNSKYNVYKLRNEAANGLYATHGWYRSKIYTPKANEEIKVSQKKNAVYVNDKQVLKMTYQELEATSTLKFGNFKGTIKSFSVWNASGKLVGEYLPAVDESGKACMYDTVNKKYVYYSGTCKAIVVEEEEEVEEEVEEEEEEILADNGADNSTDSTNNESGVYTVLKQALLTTDSSEKDISKYNISTSDFYAEWNKIKQDCYLEYHTYGNVYPLPTVQSGVVKKFQFCNMDSGYAKRLEKVKKAVNDFCDSVDNKMTDMDKVLLAHEYVVSNTQYLRYDQSATMAGGPLGNGYGICGGYADAMMVLLHYVGVETDEITSGKMGHGWLYVKVDGQWYHVDPTWDDTLKGSNEIYAHRFFIRNDSEFLDIGGKKHYSWFFTNGSKTSTSTKYVNWFVHDVAGTMYYYNGLWYYKDNSTNSIVCSDINGNARKIVVNGQQESTIKLSGISGNVLTYTVGAEKRTISL